jgi:hypothetical protein
MKPTSKREKEIVERVDQKACAVRDGVGVWDRIVTEMKIAIGFQMSVAQEPFSNHPRVAAAESDQGRATGGRACESTHY